MRDLGQLWRDYQALGPNAVRYDFRILIGAEVVPTDKIYSWHKSGGLNADDFELGNCTASRLDIELFSEGLVIPSNAQITLQVSISGNLGATPWVNCGVFYVDYRVQRANRLKLECYDAMLYGGAKYVSTEDVGTWPRTMQSVLSDISVKIKAPLRAGTLSLIDPDYMVPYPNALTMREILGFIGGANGGNFFISDDGELAFSVPSNSAPLADLQTNNIKTINRSDSSAYDKVYLVYNDDGDHYTSGTGTNSIELFNLFGTQEIADNLLAKVAGYTYNTQNATSVKIDLALELGDSVLIDGVACNLWGLDTDMTGYVDIHIPTVGTTQREFGFVGAVSSAVKRKVSLDHKYYGVSMSRTEGLKIEREDGVSTTTINSDIWEAVFNGDKKLYFDVETGEFRFNGVLSADVINALSDVITPYIYSENGAIVNAIVTRLKTDLAKPFKYLQNDTSAVPYQDIGNNTSISGRYFKVDKVVSTDPVQFKMPYVSGEGDVLLWWYDGIVGGSMTTNESSSIPDGETASTPVMAYQYSSEIIHGEYLREVSSGKWQLLQQFSMGIDESQRGAGVIELDDTYFKFIRKAGSGVAIGGLRISIEGGTEIYNKKTGQWEYPQTTKTTVREVGDTNYYTSTEEIGGPNYENITNTYTTNENGTIVQKFEAGDSITQEFITNQGGTTIQKFVTEGGTTGAIEKTENYFQFVTKNDLGDVIGGLRISNDNSVEYYNKITNVWEPIGGGGGGGATLTATLLAGGWSPNAPYTQTINVAGITATTNPIVDIVQTADVNESKTILANWANVSRLSSNTNSITAVAYDVKPTIDLQIVIKVV